MKPELGGGFNSFHIFHPGEMIQFDQHISSKSSCFCSQFGGDRMEFSYKMCFVKALFQLLFLFSLEGTEVSYLGWLKISVINPTLLHKQKQKSQVPEHCITSNGVEDL